MRKTLIGPRLRQLRREHQQTQAEMAEALGVSTAYVNLLENNQRSLSVQMLMALSDAYGVDWRLIRTLTGERHARPIPPLQRHLLPQRGAARRRRPDRRGRASSLLRLADRARHPRPVSRTARRESSRASLAEERRRIIEIVVDQCGRPRARPRRSRGGEHAGDPGRLRALREGRRRRRRDRLALLLPALAGGRLRLLRRDRPQHPHRRHALQHSDVRLPDRPRHRFGASPGRPRAHRRPSRTRRATCPS